MTNKGLGRRINQTRKDRGITSDRLSELCHINTAYLRQIEGGNKLPSLPVFITLCNALRISPDYLLRDDLLPNEISKIKELNGLWEQASPSQQDLTASMLRAALETTKTKNSVGNVDAAALQNE